MKKTQDEVTSKLPKSKKKKYLIINKNPSSSSVKKLLNSPSHDHTTPSEAHVVVSSPLDFSPPSQVTNAETNGQNPETKVIAINEQIETSIQIQIEPDPDDDDESSVERPAFVFTLPPKNLSHSMKKT